MGKTKPGPDVRIDGVDRATIIDDEGVQRFYPNPVIRRLLDEATAAAARLWFARPNVPGPSLSPTAAAADAVSSSRPRTRL